MNYTEKMEESLFQQWDIFDNNITNDYNGIIEFINESSSFRTFGEGLLGYIKNKEPEVDEENIIKYISKLCEKNGVPIKDIASKGTLKNWFFKGMKPKKSEDSRRSVFAIAFALGLNPKDTSELFHKVYLDRAFDFRNIEDIVYYYCLDNNKDWEYAKDLILKVEITESNDKTMYTSQMQKDIRKINSDDALFEYIKKHSHNLEKKNLSAKKNFQILLEKSCALVNIEAKQPGFEEQIKFHNTKSSSFVYKFIIGQFFAGTKGTATLFANARLPKEIRNRFPEIITFSKNNLSYEELRKVIILLSSYNFWFNQKINIDETDIEDYIQEINAILFDSGFSKMYYGNPYDWMFLYCSLSENPLDTFRGMIDEVLNYDNESYI